MSHHYCVTISWAQDGTNFLNGQYSRTHIWKFDGGLEVMASSSPSIVPLPYSSEQAVDPEEAFVASLSSCHMLWFLSIAAKKGFSVASYRDDASGVMGKNSEGRVAMLTVTLKPEVRFSGENLPAESVIEDMHRAAHKECFIASSVKTQVLCTPVF